MISCSKPHENESTERSGEAEYYISRDQCNVQKPSGSNSQKINDLDQLESRCNLPKSSEGKVHCRDDELL